MQPQLAADVVPARGRLEVEESCREGALEQVLRASVEARCAQKVHCKAERKTRSGLNESDRARGKREWGSRARQRA